MKTKVFDDEMSHKEVAEMLGMRPESLSSALSRGTYSFNRYKVGRRNIYRRGEIQADIERNHAA